MAPKMDKTEIEYSKYNVLWKFKNNKNIKKNCKEKL